MRNKFTVNQKSKGSSAYATLANEYPEFLPLAADLKKSLEFTMLKVTGSIMEPENYPNPYSGVLEKLLYERLTNMNDRKRDYASHIFLAKRKDIEIRRESPKFAQKNSDWLERLYDDRSMFKLPRFMDEHDMLHTHDPRLQFFETRDNSNGFDWGVGNRPYYDKIALRIHRIVCVDETNIESDSDTIALSANIIEGEVIKHRKNDGSMSYIPYQNTFSKPIVAIGQGIGDGWEMIPNPNPWYYHVFDLYGASGEEGLPKYRCCNFLLAEMDNGGFSEFVEKALKTITTIVTEAIAAYVGKKLAEEIAKGFFASALGSLIGGAIGALAVYLLYEFIDLLIEWWKDDVFPPQSADITIFSYEPSLKINGIYSELKHCTFEGHGGTYRLEYSWQWLTNGRVPSLTDETSTTPDKPVRGATIFSNVMFDGTNKFLKPGSYSLAQKSLPHGRLALPPLLSSGYLDNEVDSIKIDPGIAVFAYKTPDFTGEPLVLYNDATWLDDNWRDEISSITVVDLSIPK